MVLARYRLNHRTTSRKTSYCEYEIDGNQLFIAVKHKNTIANGEATVDIRGDYMRLQEFGKDTFEFYHRIPR